jgi:hypothetical protein
LFCRPRVLAWVIGGSPRSALFPWQGGGLRGPCRQVTVMFSDLVGSTALAECRLVFFKAQAPQPDHNVHGWRAHSRLPHHGPAPSSSSASRATAEKCAPTEETRWSRSTGWVTALAVANGVSATDITLIFDHEHDFDIGHRRTIPTDWALGGCSGAPLLTFVEQRGVCSWRLGGIIYESSQVILNAARADCLNPDGTLNPYPDLMAYQQRNS